MTTRVLLLALLLSACGIPLDAEPRPVSVDLTVPGAFEEATGVELEAVSIFLVRDDRLLHVTRNLRTPASLLDVIEVLIAGATDPEDRSGLGTSIPAGTRLIDVRVDGSVATIDLSDDFAAVGGSQEILAVAQLVLTATRVDGVDAVTFELQGVRTDVPTASGALSVEPVTAADYSELAEG